jgi:hypothetical protein
MPGTQRAFRSVETFQVACDEGRGTKMAAVLNIAKYFLETQCASMPKLKPDGTLLPQSEQDPPY